MVSALVQHVGAPARSPRWRPIAAFIALTYALTWALELGAWFTVPVVRSPIGQFVLLGVAMWMPALASFVICRATGEAWAERVGLRTGIPLRRVLGSGAVGNALVGLPTLAYVAGAQPNPLLAPTVGLTAVAGYAIVAVVLARGADWNVRATSHAPSRRARSGAG